MKLLKIHPADTVVVALTAIEAGEVVSVEGVPLTVAEPVAAGYKVALVPIAAGDVVVKYGNPIGHAICDIMPGQTVHVHNLKTGLENLLEYSYNPRHAPFSPETSGIFMGYRRSDGKVGIRNEIWIVPTVGCVNIQASLLQKAAQAFVAEEIGGVYAFPHPYGCSQLGADHENTRRVLAGLIQHPNAGGVLVLGLGCENNSVEDMREMLGAYDPNRVKFLVCQDVSDELEAGLGLLQELIAFAGQAQREPVPMSELIVGLKCGGSDGFSGITANPLVGAFTDRLISEGGSAILTEVPEMFGAETILMNRCRTPELFDKTVALINDFKTYFIESGQAIYENPSPGNKAGGISTLEDKSLGCIQKGGCSDVTDVLGYAEPVCMKGLNLLSGPGNDLVSISNMTASGAHLILFTTGLGTPFGAPVPTVKISSNTALFEKKRAWIDFDAGPLLNGTPMGELRDELYTFVRALASGECRSKNEMLGAREFTIFKTGVTL
ncbi:MAG: altronate dehydratase family protein [Oscillospiraceae bacterium]|nr:altronate dehydratase family protein [Oscillospiraceae bacterium]